MKVNNIIAFLMLLLMASCQETLITDSDERSGFVLEVESMGGDPAPPSLLTRAGTAVDETTISNIWVLQFNGTDNGAILTHAAYRSDLASMDVGDMLDFTNTSNQTVYFVANTFNPTLCTAFHLDLNISTLNDFNSRSFAITGEASNYVNFGGTNYLRMVGSYTGNIQAGVIHISMRRLVAKISFSYDIFSSAESSDGSRLEIISVQLKNVPNKCSYTATMDNTTVPESVIFSAPYQTYQPGTVSGPGAGYSYSIGVNEGDITFYMPENIAGVVNTNTLPEHKTANAPGNAAYLEVLAMHYLPSHTEPDKSIMMSIYLGQNSITDYNVQINKNYNVTLNVSDSDDEWLDDSRIDVVSNMLPTANLAVRYEFNEAIVMNSYQEDIVSGYYNVRNLVGGNFATRIDGGTIPESVRRYTKLDAENNCLVSTGYAFDTGWMGDKTTEDEFTIIFVGSVDTLNQLGVSFYGPANGENQRWYLGSYNLSGLVGYGVSNISSATIQGNYVLNLGSKMFFADISQGNSRMIYTDIQEIFVNESVPLYSFTSNLYLGNNAQVSGYCSIGLKVWLFLCYDRELTISEIRSIKAYAISMGYL